MAATSDVKNMVIGKILYLSHSGKLIRVGINTTIEDVYQRTNNLSVDGENPST
jgi:hypothetical protein